jgi:hypothetical protein
MPDRVVQRSKVAEGIAFLAVFVALITSFSVYSVNKRAVTKINDSRKDIAFNTCIGQNMRHDNTVRVLDRQLDLAKDKATPAQLIQIRKSRQFTVFLLDALAPKQNCSALVEKRFG